MASDYDWASTTMNWISEAASTAAETEVKDTNYFESIYDWGSENGSDIWGWLNDEDNSAGIGMASSALTGLASYMGDDSWSDQEKADAATILNDANLASAERMNAANIAFQEKALAEETNRLRRHNESFQKGGKTYAED